MDFHINKNATLPILKLELIKDGRNDYSKFHDMIQNSDITFCMTDLDTGIRKIGNKNGICILKEVGEDSTIEEYYIGYKFTSKDTKKSGTFIGEFTINFVDDAIGPSGLLIVPIRDELRIHILEGSIRK